MEEKEVLKKLLVDEEEVTRRLEEKVDKAEKIFKIEAGSGRIIFNDYTKLADIQRVSTLLCGKYFGKQLGLKISDALGVSEIARELNRPPTALSGVLGELLKRGWISKDPHRKYRIVPYHIDEVLDDGLRKMGRK